MEYTVNGIIDEIRASREMLFEKADISELLDSSGILLIRSAKEELLECYLTELEARGYDGTIYIIGRESDRRFLRDFAGLHIDIYSVREEEKYQIGNVGERVAEIKAKGIETACFLCRNYSFEGYSNVLEILSLLDICSYALADDREIYRVKRVKKYLLGRRLYDALCEWYYAEDQ